MDTAVNGESVVHIWDGSNIVMDVDGDDGAVIDRYIRGITLLASDVQGYYLYNAHGDVVQLADGSGAVTKDYDYDAFGVQLDSDGLMVYTQAGDALFEDTDTNPWRYCGEYFDVETNTIYLRARYYNPALGRFLAEDTHWNIDNMVYGDNPVKWNERRSDEKDPLGLNEYTLLPDANAMRQSANLYAYALNNPTMYADPSGKIIWLTIAIGAAIGGVVGGGANIIVQSFTKGLGNINWVEVGIAAGSGTMSGSLAGSGAGLVWIVAGNSVIGAGSYAAIQVVNGEKITITELAINAGIGAIFGAIGGSSQNQVKELAALHQAYKSAAFSSGKEINKMLFRELFMKEMVKAPFAQGMRDEIIQFFLDRLY